MKRILLKLFLSVICFHTYALSGLLPAPGSLLEKHLVKSFSSEELKAFFKKIRVPSIFLAAKKGVNVFEIIYTTRYADGNIIRASGLVFAPVGERRKLPMLVYNQGTDICRERAITFRGEQAMCLAYATDDYLVLMPDYVGMGKGDRCHLYLHAETEASATVDMIIAVTDSIETFGVKGYNKLFLSGYSQGGHACMATHRKLQEEYADRFKVTASAPMSGPYDVFYSVFEGRNKRYDYPGYMAYLIKSYYETNGYPERIGEVFVKPIDSLLPPLLTGEFPMHEINKLLPDTAFKAVREDFYRDFETNPDNPFRQYLIKNSVYNWAPEAPVKLYYCDNDEQVTYKNSIIAYETMKKNGAKKVELWRAGKKFKHVNCALFAIIYAKMFFDGFVHDRPGSHGPAFKRLLLNIGKLAIRP
ncbi:MAG: lipase family protein [Chitinophagales bacterium]|nr:hypothetical protein [Chitinophagales bacterium]MDW8273373.1 lipase family protein [Chitinophagales bacterium]